MLEFKKKKIEKEKIFSSLWYKNYTLVILGSLLVALSCVFFIIPHKLVPGGVFGISIIINSLTDLPIGTIALCINIPLLLLGIKILGGKFGIKTILSMILCSVFIDTLTYLFKDIMITKDILVSALFGGTLIGSGAALVIKAGATTGGTDIVAKIISTKLKFPLSKLFMIIDGTIVLTATIVFKDIDIASYCIISIFSISKSIDLVLNGFNNKKAAFIISEKHQQIRNFILENDCGGSYIDGNGLFFKNTQKKIIFTTVDRKDLTRIENFVKITDKDAFITIMDTNDVFGNGFNNVE